MQHNITRGDIVLLGETIRLLTLSSQPRGEAPKALHPNVYNRLPTPSGFHAYSAIDVKGPALSKVRAVLNPEQGKCLIPKCSTVLQRRGY